jgi:hypothetical protein
LFSSFHFHCSFSKLILTERGLVNTPALYSGGPEFKHYPLNRLS